MKLFFIFFGITCCISFFLILEMVKIHHYYKNGFISVLDVEEGDATFIITPGKQKILIDGGKGNTIIKKLGQYLSFFDKQIDLIIITSPDNRNLPDIIEILHRYTVQRIILNVSHTNKAPIYGEFLSLIRKKNIELHVLSGNKDIRFTPNFIVDVIDPGLIFSSQGLPQSSFFRFFINGNPKFLFLNDTDSAIQKQILTRDYNIKTETLKIGQQGDKKFLLNELLKAINPKKSVISVDKNNTNGYPHYETIEKLRNTLIKITHNEGDIRLL